MGGVRTSCGGPDAVGRRMRITVTSVHFGDNKALDVPDGINAGAEVELASGLWRRYKAPGLWPGHRRPGLPGC